jgi:PTS hybrid protein
VSHSVELARGLAELAAQVAGPEVRVEPAGGGPEGVLGTSGSLVESALTAADQGAGVVVLADLGSAILTIRHVLGQQANGHARLADAPFVEGAVAAAVTSASGASLDEVLRAAEEARDIRKL